MYCAYRRFPYLRACRIQVGAVSINAKLDCDSFANTHSSTSHFDRDSFVGAASSVAYRVRRVLTSFLGAVRTGMAPSRRRYMLRDIQHGQGKVSTGPRTHACVRMANGVMRAFFLQPPGI